MCDLAAVICEQVPPPGSSQTQFKFLSKRSRDENVLNSFIEFFFLLSLVLLEVQEAEQMSITFKAKRNNKVTPSVFPKKIGLPSRAASRLVGKLAPAQAPF